MDSIEQAPGSVIPSMGTASRAVASRVIPLRRAGVTAGPVAAPDDREPLWRHVVGDVLRRERLGQERTLKDVADDARISMPYLSEIERGRKEASSEVLAAAARALGLGLADLLALAQDELARRARPLPARFPTGFGPAPVRPGPRGGQAVSERAHEAAFSAVSETRIAFGAASPLGSGPGSAGAAAPRAVAPRDSLCLAA